MTPDTNTIYYILSSKQIFSAKPRNINDRISWLLENETFKEAFELARQKPEDVYITQGTLLEVGQLYMNSLFAFNDFKSAAELCPEILNLDGKAWKKWVYKFAETNSLHEVFRYVPFENIVLDSSIYELILSKFLDLDSSLFLCALQLWPSNIYKIYNVITSINEAMKIAPNDTHLLESLYIL